MKVKYKIVDSWVIAGRGLVFSVEFDKPYKREEVCSLKGKKVNGREIIGIELNATGEGCTHTNAGLLVRGI